jgi:hypothetical protein
MNWKTILIIVAVVAILADLLYIYNHFKSQGNI